MPRSREPRLDPVVQKEQDAELAGPIAGPAGTVAPGAPAEDSAADWVGQAAHRAEHRAERHGSWLDYPATFALVGVNLLVFAIMFRFGPVPNLLHNHQWSGLLTTQFDIGTLVDFGGSATWLLLRGQWWRVLTAPFIHATVLHLLINLWCLWNLGLFGEPLLGKPGLVFVYLLTGAAGNLVSLAWNVFARSDGVVVGASGAIFGIAGILIVLLSNRGLVKRDLSWEEIRGLRTQVILFAAINLVFGLAPNLLPSLHTGVLARLHVGAGSLPHVDNTAHLGGFAAGLALGLPLFPRMIAGKRAYRRRQRATFATAALLLALFGYAVAKFA